MATTAFPATAIFDSGATGRELIQAADQAAAQAAIGVDPSDYGLLDSDNTWLGDNTFTQTLTVPHITSEGELLKLQSPTGYNLELFSGTARLVRLTYSEMQFLRSRLTPEIDDFSDLGKYNKRWSDVMAHRFGATESMTVYKLGNETENTNTEYLETKWDSTKNSWVMRPKYSGSGTYRDFAIESSISNRAYIKFSIGGSSVALGYGYHYTGQLSALAVGSSYIQIGKDTYPASSVVDTLSLGKTTNRWGLVASVNADISGTLTTDTINASGSELDLQLGGNTAIKVNSSFSYYYGAAGNTYILQGSDFLRPQGGAAQFDLGGISHRWRTAFVVDGSFTGNLVSEVGGSYKHYKLGDASATNAEFYEASFDGSVYKMYSKAIGTGVEPQIEFGSTDCQINVKPAQNQAVIRTGGSARLVAENAGVYVTTLFKPSSNGLQSLGTSTARWSNFYAVNANLSGVAKTGDGSVTAPSYSFGSQSTMGIYRAATNQINMIAATGGKGFNLQSTSLSISSTMAFGWRSVPNISQGHSFDTLLARDATGIIAQRNFFADAPQAFRIYGTWTDASNGEWLQMDHGVTHANIATISNQDNGTGTGRHLYIKAADQLRLYSGGNLLHWVHTGTQAIYYKDAIRPHGTSDFGTTGNRWANGYFVAGDFSGTVTANAFVGDGSGLTNLPGGGGNPFDQDLNTTDSPSFVDGDFSGDLTVSSIVNTGGLDIDLGGNLIIRHNTSASYLASSTAFYPNNSKTLGTTTKRWAMFYGSDASLTGNLVNEVGGSYKLYNLGDESATDQEYLDISSTTNVYKIAPLRTGAGAVRQFKIEGCYGANFGNINFDTYGFLNLGYGQTPSISMRSGGSELLKDMYPNITYVDTLSLGKSTARFGEFYSVDGDFSGTLTASNGVVVNAGRYVGLGYSSTKLSFATTSALLQVGTTTIFNAFTTQVQFYKSLVPNNTGSAGIGLDSKRWSGVFSQNGSFSSNLNVETGGVFRSYAEGDSHTNTTNTRYVSLEYNSSGYPVIEQKATGSSAIAYMMRLVNGSASFSLKSNGGFAFQSGSADLLLINAGSLRPYKSFYPPNNTGTVSIGAASFRFQTIFGRKFDVAETWNDAATTFDLITGDITDTASDAESSLLNLKVGGASYLRLRKNGDLLFEKNGGSARIVQNAGGIAILGDNGSTVQSFDQYFNYTYKTFRPISDNQHLGYVSRRFLVKANDIYSKGKIRSYNLGDETAVDAEYLNLHWLSDHAYLTCEATGTGTARQFSVGTHTNGSIRFNHGTNTIRFSVGGVTATKMYLNSSGLTLYGVMSPQGQKTRDLGTTAARWRELFVGDIDADGTCTATAFVGDGSGLTGLPSGSSTLSGLTDTNVSSPANGNLLIYDAVSSKWDNALLTSSDSSVTITVGAGTINLAAGGVGPSDARLKENVKEIENALGKVSKMLPVEFDWKEGFDDVHSNKGKDIGFIAQDIEEIQPELVGSHKDYKTLQYEKFAPLIIGAIKELSNQIQEIKSKLG